MTVSQPPEPLLVTVALPTFRPGAYLLPAVQSILNQTMPNFELLIFDDWGGDDAVAQIAALNDPRVTIIDDGRNVGLAARLNQAIDMARGQYFARMDHDDIAHPERLGRQTRFLAGRADIDLLGTGCITMDEHSHLTGSLPLAVEHEDICRRAWLGFYMPHPTWMARLSWFTKHRYSPHSPYFSEDQELLLRCHEISRYHVLPEALLAYRMRSTWSLPKRLKTRWALLKLQIAYFGARKQFSTAALSVLAYLARILSDCLAQAGILKPNPAGTTNTDVQSAWRAIIEEAGKTSPRTAQ